MKKILFIPVALLALGACTNEVDEVFETPAADRLNGRMLECRQLLTASEHGWEFVYYPSSDRQFGGSTYTAKFDEDGNVSVTGEIAADLHRDVEETVTSHYSIKASSSVVLAFDTYNDYIHYWSDPDPYGGNAWEGDFEFEYMEGDESRMVFRGTKTGNEIVFTALDEDIAAAARKVLAMRDTVAGKLYAAFDWSDGSETVRLYDDDNYSVMTHYLSGDTEGDYETLAYAFTETGISFYRPVTIGGVTAQNFDYDAGSGKLVSVDGKDASGAVKEVSLTGAHAENFVHYNDLIGTFSMPCTLSTGSVSRVRLTEGKRLKTFKLEGLVDEYPLELAYRKSDCSLSLTTQYLGDLQGRYVYLCPWDTETGYLTWSSGIGMTLTRDEGEGISFTFKDNGVWGGYVVSGFLYYVFSGPPSNDTADGYYVRLYDLTTMTKID